MVPIGDENPASLVHSEHLPHIEIDMVPIGDENSTSGSSLSKTYD